MAAYVILQFLLILVNSYRPVVIIHGLREKASDLDFLKQSIQQAHPGTRVYVIDKFTGNASFTSCLKQTDVMIKDIKIIMKKHQSGINIIGYSQGGLIARGIIEKLDHHNIDTFISISAPQNGQYGETDFVRKLYPNLPKNSKKFLHKFFYTKPGQKISFAGYWRDPFNHQDYLSWSSYLADINGEKGHPTRDYRQSFLMIQQLVTIGGPADGVIEPWQSAHFEHYKENQDVAIAPVDHFDFFKNDNFGLRTLHRLKKWTRHEVKDVAHSDWIRNQDVIDKYILPYLD